MIPLFSFNSLITIIETVCKIHMLANEKSLSTVLSLLYAEDGESTRQKNNYVYYTNECI